jgi:hypothetical protein
LAVSTAIMPLAITRMCVSETLSSKMMRKQSSEFRTVAAVFGDLEHAF